MTRGLAETQGSAALRTPRADRAGEDCPADSTVSAEAAAPRGSALDVLDRLRGVDPVLDESGCPWPASEIARALCDCTLTRAVVGAADQPLNLGRDERLFKRSHWLALYASGVRTCAVDGCGMPIAFTELHHMRWWEGQNGRTDLANCAAECTFHHHEIHRLGITVTRRPDGTYEHRLPDGRLYGGALPGDDSPASVYGGGGCDEASAGAIGTTGSARSTRSAARPARPT